MGPAQREAILRALNEDADKLLQEYGPQRDSDPDCRRLREEMDRCNQIFSQLSAKLQEEGKEKKK